MAPSRSEFITVRGMAYHVRHWGREGAPQLFMLHGWMDVSASFQFVVDCLKEEWHVIAPDWRGFGLSEWNRGDTYWFPDYLGDLDAILNHYAPQGAVDLLGHSMGGNVAAMYAGVRPERIRRLINLEGSGLAAAQPERAPAHYARWLDQLPAPEPLRPYPSVQAVAARLQKTNPRLSDERAAFLARHWAAPNDSGAWEILGDPRHKGPSPLMYRLDEMLACWSAIKAPVLWVEAEQTDMWKWMGTPEADRSELDRRLGHLADLRRESLADAGHMLHHDQPERVALLVEDFLAQ